MSGKKKHAKQTGGTGSGPAAAPPRMPAVTGSSFWYIGLLAALLGVMLYANTLGHEYCYDDSSAITENSLVRGGIKNIPALFKTEYRYGYEVRHNPGPHYRPLSLVVFALAWQLLPDQPWFYHLINVLLYGFTGWLLWVTWRRILASYSPLITAVSVLVFMAHPVHTEVVANIKSIDEILTLIFFNVSLYGLWRYLENASRAWLAGAVVSYGLALLSKESAITFLAVFPLTIWFFTDRKAVDNLKLSALFLIPAGLFLLVRTLVLSAQTAESEQSIITNFIGFAPDFGGRLASAFMMCAQYLKALIFPHPLVCDMGYPQMKPVTFADWRALAGLLAGAGMGAAALYTARSKKLISYAILFFLATFSLYSNIVYLIGTCYGERLLYMPSLGFAFVTGLLLHRIFQPEKTGRHTALWLACAVLVVLYGAKTVVRNSDWKNDLTLFSTDILTSPNSAHMNFNYGKQLLVKGYDKKRGLLLDAGLVEQAVERFTKSLQLYPGNAEAYGERGWSYVRLKKYDLAYADYMKGLEMNPGGAQGLSALGYLCRNFRNEPDRAEALYRKAIAADPRFVEPRRNLGALLATSRQFDQAIQIWKDALTIAPEDIALYRFIGRAYADKGKPDEGRSWLEKASALEKAGKE